MGEKSIIMSLSVKPEMQERLKGAAKKAGWSVSELVRNLIERHLSLIVNENNDIPVILRIPSALKGDPEKLKEWLDARTQKIVASLSNNS
jgi:hypothetical protein